MNSKLSSGQIKLLIISAIVAAFAFGMWVGKWALVKKILERLW